MGGRLKVRLLPAVLAAAAVLAAPAESRPAAWRAVSPGGTTFTLLGSIHYLRDSDYPLHSSIDQLYGAADTLIMELDLDDLDPLQMSQALMQRGMARDGMLLSDRLSPDTLRKTTELAGEVGLGAGQLSGLEPWLVALMLTQLKMAQLGFDPNVGVEQHLLGRARSDQKEILGLESVDDQLAVFDSLTDAQQAEFLAQTVAEMGQLEDQAAQLVDAWQRGQVDTLAADLLAGLAAYPDLYRRLVAARNQDWAYELAHLARAQPRDYLVVVGTLHLVGEDSLVALLEQRGYQIVRLDTP